MRSNRRSLAILASVAIEASLLPVATSAAAPPPGGHDDDLPSKVALDWQRIALRTIFTEGATPPQVGTLYLAFSSLAVHDAVHTALKRGNSSAQAAAAVAAHDVLVEYFPGSETNLGADLLTSLAAVPDGPMEAKGIRIGRASAEEMIESRVGDGRNDASIVYAKAPALGIWQPPPGGAMATAWLGFVRPVVDVDPVAVDGPDALTSLAYVADYEEVRRLGSVASLDRTQPQTDTARFFAFNPPLMYRDALCRYLDTAEMGLAQATHLFALIDAATANSMIQTFRLKFDLGFWRPFQAIDPDNDDGNPATVPEDDWTPLIPNPAYADYTSGHAAATAPFAEVVREVLGDDTSLALRSGANERTYATMSDIEFDALHARIWGGLHFRDAMEDGYLLGHETAQRVMEALGQAR